MKKIKIIVFIAVIPFLSNCEMQKSSKNDNDFESYDDNDIALLIDRYCGHPNDAQITLEALGATDEVLEASDPRDIANLIEDSKEFALDKVEEDPHYLFGLGRAAYFFGYNQKATQWLNIAAENGSAAANAYLGYISYYEDENVDKALSYLEIAMQKGFNDLQVKEVYGYCNYNPKKEKFNEVGIITALFNKDWSYINNKELSEFYLAKLHETLWSNDILWLAEDPKILLELDPALSRTTAAWVERGFSFLGLGSGANAMQSSAIQDAKRLAILYNSNPIAFRRIYNSISEYANHKN
ncbi:hypothetical protein [Flavivirga spongiicola]|uniref:Sel1 repeat family protein n=1 Tax=Flavivirga spongiicola TaxID=421621 RepID=A0ABU7XYT5_9FLAO|nr:hypothetical protein [Flavivirga sp. MEBiC05379]MDO5980947.1 hypothetical protein [Flavivirga sp. MEBiC05379]